MLSIPDVKSTSSASGKSPILVLTNPSCSRWSIEDGEDVGVAAKGTSKLAVMIVNETVSLEAKNHGKVKVDNSDRKLEKYFVFAFDGKVATCLNPHSAEGAFVINQRINPEAAALGEQSFSPFVENEEDSTAAAGTTTLEGEDGPRVKRQEFGSKKQQSRVKRAMMNRISGAAVAGAEDLKLNKFLDKNTDNAVDDLGEESATQQNSLLPPYDELADTPQLAYPSHGYFPLEDRALVGLIQLPATLTTSTFCHLQLHRVNSLDAETRKKRKVQERVLVISYLVLLLQLKNGRRMVGSAKSLLHSMVEVPGLTVEMVERLLARFMEKQPDELGGGFAQTKTLKDKLLLYILVVALSLENYFLDKKCLHDLAADLKMDPSSLSPFLFQLGCRQAGDRGEVVFKLVVPLKFPSSGGRKKKRASRA